MKGGVPANMSMQNELQFNTMIPKSIPPDQQRMMQDSLNKIDDLLKKECIFCGPVLIDMIDNDIDQDDDKPKSAFNDHSNDDEWAIR